MGKGAGKRRQSCSITVCHGWLVLPPESSFFLTSVLHWEGHFYRQKLKNTPPYLGSVFFMWFGNSIQFFHCIHQFSHVVYSYILLYNIILNNLILSGASLIKQIPFSLPQKDLSIRFFLSLSLFFLGKSLVAFVEVNKIPIAGSSDRLNTCPYLKSTFKYTLGQT